MRKYFPEINVSNDSRESDESLSHPPFFPRVFFSLKYRLMMLITVSLLLVVGGPLVYLSQLFDRNFEDFSVEMIETASNAVYQSIFEGFMRNDSRHIQQNLQILATDPAIELIRIYDNNGTIIYSSQPDEISQTIYDIRNADSVRIIPTPDEGLFINFGDHYSHQHPIEAQEACLPCHQNTGEIMGTIDVQIDLSRSRMLMERSKKLTLASGIVIIVILWIVLSVLYRGQIEARLSKIVKGFQELARGNMNYHIEMMGQNELSELGRHFNQTVDKLRQAHDMEKQFIQENLERADRLVTLGEVAAEIAHEVNNPAGIILIRAELIRDDLAARGMPPEILEDMDSIVRQTERIAETTKNILHYARKRPHTDQNVDLNEVITQAIKVLQPRIKKRQVVVKLDNRIPEPIISGDFSQLEQVFCNLINNCLDAVPPHKGEINIEIFRPDNQEADSSICISFTDNGPGIPPEIRKHIFAPFYTTKKDGKGTGLGLFIVRNIITNHGGKIYLASPQPPKGTCFMIELGVGNGKP